MVSEQYKFTWIGKTEAGKEAEKPVTNKELKLCENESKQINSTNNIYIEGDNLYALKLLQKDYDGKIKCIYIDPPYNSGSNFIYDDDYRVHLNHYLQLTGQNKSNYNKSEAEGRHHYQWLNMMYPRLKLAHRLLRDDGIIYISIKDYELYNLKKVCDEIFGEEQFVATLTIQGSPVNCKPIINSSKEYVLVYVKNLKEAKKREWGVKNKHFRAVEEIYNKYKPNYPRIKKKLKQYYKDNKLKDNKISCYTFVDENGVFRKNGMASPKSDGHHDPRVNPKTGRLLKPPVKGWTYCKETWDELVSENQIYFPDDDSLKPARKTYADASKLEPINDYHSIFTYKDNNYLKKLFNTDTPVFSNIKPVKLIKLLIENCNDKEAIVLDFFSGSCTTACAVMELNKKDNGNRKFIMVQKPSEIGIKTRQTKLDGKVSKTAMKFLEKHGLPNNLCEIGKERIRRTGDDLIKDGASGLDIGFKCYKIKEKKEVK